MVSHASALPAPGAAQKAERSEARPCPLATLRPGEGGTIVRVEVTGQTGERLLDLGFVPGTQVTLRRRAPLGDPSLFELRGTRICLRRSEALRILVRPTRP